MEQCGMGVAADEGVVRTAVVGLGVAVGALALQKCVWLLFTRVVPAMAGAACGRPAAGAALALATAALPERLRTPLQAAVLVYSILQLRTSVDALVRTVSAKPEEQGCCRSPAASTGPGASVPGPVDRTMDGRRDTVGALDGSRDAGGAERMKWLHELVRAGGRVYHFEESDDDDDTGCVCDDDGHCSGPVCEAEGHCSGTGDSSCGIDDDDDDDDT